MAIRPDDDFYVSPQSEPAEVGMPVASSAEARASGDGVEREGSREHRGRGGDEVVVRLSQIDDGWFTDEDEDGEPPGATASDIVLWNARVPEGDVDGHDEGDGGEKGYHESVV
jgi:hypothetical protein